MYCSISICDGITAFCWLVADIFLKWCFFILDTDYWERKKIKHMKAHDYWSIPTRKHSGSVYKWRLLPRNVYFIINYYLIPGFTPKVTWFHSSDTISEEDCRVFVLRRRSDFHLSRPVLSHQIIYSHTIIPSYKLYIQTYIHTFMHTYIHTNIHSHIHAYIHSCIYTFMHLHTYKNHLYTIASTTLSLDSTKFQKNVIPSVIHFRWQVPQTVSLQIYIFFSGIFSSFTSSNIAFSLSCVLLSYNESKHQHCFYLYLVSCSPTMTADTNIVFTFTLCLALLQWQQTPTLFLPLPCVLLSNNDNKHKHCIYLYLVSCSSTMTANTNIAFIFTLCLALQQWQQTQTLHLPLPGVLLSYNDSKHQHCLFFTLCLALLPWQQTPTLPFLYLVSCSPTMTTDTDIAFTFILCIALLHWHQTNLSLYHLQAFVP